MHTAYLANAIARVMAAVTAEKLAHATGAPASWHIMGALMMIDLVAWLGIYLASSKARTAKSA